jgi:ADP-ribosyltransferase exoenzyme
VRVLAVRDDGAQLVGDAALSHGMVISDAGRSVVPVASALARGEWEPRSAELTVHPREEEAIRKASVQHRETDAAPSVSKGWFDAWMHEDRNLRGEWTDAAGAVHHPGHLLAPDLGEPHERVPLPGLTHHYYRLVAPVMGGTEASGLGYRPPKHLSHLLAPNLGTPQLGGPGFRPPKHVSHLLAPNLGVPETGGLGYQPPKHPPIRMLAPVLGPESRHAQLVQAMAEEASYARDHNQIGIVRFLGQAKRQVGHGSYEEAASTLEMAAEAADALPRQGLPADLRTRAARYRAYAEELRRLSKTKGWADDKVGADVYAMGRDIEERLNKGKSPRGSAQTLRDYWTHHGHGGPTHYAGADAIAWGTPGDFDRCVAALTPHLGAGAKGYCNLRHHEALGYWPAQHAEMLRGKTVGITKVGPKGYIHGWIYLGDGSGKFSVESMRGERGPRMPHPEDAKFYAHSVPGDKLTDKEIGPVSSYTWGGDFVPMNDALRTGGDMSGGMEPQLAVKVAELSSVISEHRLKKPLLVHRAMLNTYASRPGQPLIDMRKELRPGRTFTDYGFTSTTYDPDVAEDFVAPDAPGIIANIKLPTGTQALSVGDATGYDQREVILQRGSEFRITSTHQEGPHLIVDMELRSQMAVPHEPAD